MVRNVEKLFIISIIFPLLKLLNFCEVETVIIVVSQLF